MSESFDGYHTFDELYAHRTVLWALVTQASGKSAWRAKAHPDGTMFDGMFIVGMDIRVEDGLNKQVSYHVDQKFWGLFDHCTTLERAPEYDGHTPDDVVKRLIYHLEWLRLWGKILTKPHNPPSQAWLNDQ